MSLPSRLPDGPFYACEDEFCAEEISYPPDMLWWWPQLAQNGTAKITWKLCKNKSRLTLSWFVVSEHWLTPENYAKEMRRKK